MKKEKVRKTKKMKKMVYFEHEEDATGRVSSFVKNEPTKKQYNAIRAVHNSIAGHQGVTNTMAKLKQKEKRWAYMKRHLE